VRAPFAIVLWCRILLQGLHGTTKLPGPHNGPRGSFDQIIGALRGRRDLTQKYEGGAGETLPAALFLGGFLEARTASAERCQVISAIQFDRFWRGPVRRFRQDCGQGSPWRGQGSLREARPPFHAC